MDSYQAILNRGYPGSTWGNLGLWTEAKTYPEACEALAIRLAEHAGLQPGDRLLDAGFGHGDQLVIWKRCFKVGPITGIEVDPDGIASALARTAAFPDVTLDFDRHPWAAGSFDKVLALDCAYHFAPRHRFLSRAKQALRAGGAVALTDLLVGSRPGLLAKLLARVCGIPTENLLTVDGYVAELNAAGFEDIRIEHLDHVLDGFADFAAAHLRRHAVPSLSRGGLRIRVSAFAVRLLGSRVRYVAVAARAAKVTPPVGKRRIGGFGHLRRSDR